METKLEKIKRLKEAAMPEVKRIVKKYGKSVVYGCIMKLSAYDKKMRLLETAKKK